MTIEEATGGVFQIDAGAVQPLTRQKCEKMATRCHITVLPMRGRHLGFWIAPHCR